MPKRSPKKTEILQVRVPHVPKRDFMERCRLENRVASDVVRDFLESYLARPVEILRSENAIMIRKRFIYPTLTAAGLVGAILTFLPLASQARSLQEEFRSADKNHDGQLLATEWTVALAEPDAPAFVLTRKEMVVTRDIKRLNPDGLNGRATASIHPDDLGMNLVLESDTDGDGRVSFAEYRALRVRMATELFRRADVDGDGMMTKVEYVNAVFPAHILRERAQDDPIWAARRAAERQFDSVDKGGKGIITLDAYLPA
jgi:hypothetical protein